ncbi:MAG: LysR family glycine cleavage system transcriptional activator [Gammaproteobacteria bacterium]|jgi:DNA-binding transcriptional LysR family regulator
MARRHYKLPSLTGLNTFDACARHGSLTQAAAELGVTLGAVSRQIKSLETDLGSALFKRHHRGVELTKAGLELHQVLSSSFRNIGNAWKAIKTRGETANITIGATTAFASLWLMPRLGGFWSMHKQIALNHAISDNPDDEGFRFADIRIRYGDGHWPGESATRLFDDIIYPVCGRLFAEQLSEKNELIFPDHLANMPLLRLDSLDPAWIGWNHWIAKWGVELPESNFRRFNNYVVALQAAEENQGVALGWDSQVGTLIKQNKLVRLGDMEMKAPGSYYLTWDSKQPLSEQARLLSDWLVGISGI